MVELLTTYSLTEILIFIVLLAGAYKALSSFIDWWKTKRRKDTLEEMKPEELEKQLNQEKEERKKQLEELDIKHEQRILDLQQKIGGVADQVSDLSNKIDLLIESDKDDIKAYVTREYHYFVEQKGWIDDYSMDSIERRYTHYLQENGNSFVSQLMDALRALPRTPPEK